MTTKPIAALACAQSAAALAPHFEQLALALAADMLERRGVASAREPGDERSEDGPLSVEAAIQVAADRIAHFAPLPGLHVMCPSGCCFQQSPWALLLAHLYTTEWQPDWTATVLDCTTAPGGCVLCPEHRHSDPLYASNNACHGGCEPCARHEDMFMHPLHMAQDFGNDELIDEWQGEHEGDAPYLIATLRAAGARLPAEDPRAVRLAGDWPGGWTVTATPVMNIIGLALCDPTGACWQYHCVPRPQDSWAIKGVTSTFTGLDQVGDQDPVLRNGVRALMDRFGERRTRAMAQGVVFAEAAQPDFKDLLDTMASTYDTSARAVLDLDAGEIVLYLTASTRLAGLATLLDAVRAAAPDAPVPCLEPDPETGAASVALTQRQALDLLRWLRGRATAHH